MRLHKGQSRKPWVSYKRKVREQIESLLTEVADSDCGSFPDSLVERPDKRVGTRGGHLHMCYVGKFRVHFECDHEQQLVKVYHMVYASKAERDGTTEPPQFTPPTPANRRSGAPEPSPAAGA
jgi:mRNA-degrading endonuclease RelE of RelBE toxin-antitoxin system